MNRSDHDPRPSARVYARLRTAQLERFRRMAPAVLLFNETRYDYDPTAEDENDRPRQVNRLRAVGHLLGNSYRVVEVVEPAVVNRWCDVAAQILAMRARSLLLRRRTRIVTYCIGTIDPSIEAAQRWHLPPRVARWCTWIALNALVRATDRLAFGTTGSLEMYASYVGRTTLNRRSRIFEAVPSPCVCLATSIASRDLDRLVFVGALEERKGVPELMSAWDVVRERSPAARLTVVGKGSLTAKVIEWAAGKDDVEVVIDPPRELIHEALRSCAALVLLSQPGQFWREQIGLPILEGLAHGCEIVTTTETGLATWLDEHGHEVVHPGSAPRVIADAIISALARARQREGSLAELPHQDNRIIADDWLMSSP